MISMIPVEPFFGIMDNYDVRLFGVRGRTTVELSSIELTLRNFQRKYG